MIVTASVFAGLLLIYLLVASRRQGERRLQSRRLAKYYSSENLAKMEYDVAAYHKEEEAAGVGSQMTIDEFINRKEEGAQKSVSELYTPIEDEGLKELVGHYNPDSDS